MKQLIELQSRNGLGDRSVCQEMKRADRVLRRLLSSKMRELVKDPSRTKRTAARLAVVGAIREGYLGPGDHLPSEKDLTSILDVSLGTVQAALRQLQQSGTIIRRRGDGTRIASAEPFTDSIWHFRFLAKTTNFPLRFVDQHVEIDRSERTGPWSSFFEGSSLATSPSQFVCIRRRIRLNNDTFVFADMYLDEQAAGGLLEIRPEELDMINIRPYLEEAFGLRTARASHRVGTTILTPEETRQFGLLPKKIYFEIHAKAYTAESRPVYFQRILADSSRCVLDF